MINISLKEYDIYFHVHKILNLFNSKEPKIYFMKDFINSSILIIKIVIIISIILIQKAEVLEMRKKINMKFKKKNKL